MNVIVCGTRGVKEDPAKMWLFNKLREHNDEYGIYRLLHGDNKRSPDMWGEEWCVDNSVYYEPFPADWETFGKAAGHIRNQEMADYAEALIGPTFVFAVWDGKSRGTLSMIEKAVQKGFGVEIIPARLED